MKAVGRGLVHRSLIILIIAIVYQLFRAFSQFRRQHSHTRQNVGNAASVLSVDASAAVAGVS